MTSTQPDMLPRIAVLGCGLIGQSWTALFMYHGHPVAAWDPDPDARAALTSAVDLPMAQLAELGPGAGRRNAGAVAYMR